MSTFTENKTKPARVVVILQHVPNETAGTLIDHMRCHRIPFQPIELYKNDPLPADIKSIRTVVIMGGPMNVDEESKYPFLKEEDSFLKKMIENKIPCLGVCLGSQLLAKALGARVYKAQAPEVGWDDVRLSSEAKKDPLLSGIEEPVLKVLQWHEDTFDLPKNAVRLASSAVVPNQAFRYGKNIYGFQFHVEVDRPILEDWFRESDKCPEILAEFDRYQEKLSGITNRIYQKFFDLSERVSV